jgi:hypothetical protein
MALADQQLLPHQQPRSRAQNRGDYYQPAIGEAWLACTVTEYSGNRERRAQDPELSVTYVWVPERGVLCGLVQAVVVTQEMPSTAAYSKSSDSQPVWR